MATPYRVARPKSLGNRNQKPRHGEQQISERPLFSLVSYGELPVSTIKTNQDPW
jgi:hypothetical protein